MSRYIHYGCKSFDENKFNPIKNQSISTKPLGGFWASPMDTSYGWSDWCRSEKPHWCNYGVYFTFRLSDKANVVHIRNEKELSEMPVVEKSLINGVVCIDFEKMLNDGVDAVELHLMDKGNLNHGLFFALYGWLCDSILIMNPKIILPD